MHVRVCVRQYLLWRPARYLCRLPPVLYALIWHATLFPDVQGGLRASHDTARLAVTYKAHALSCLHWYSLYLNCDRNVIAQSASTIQMTACDITMGLFISLCGCGRLHTTATMRRESATDSLLHHLCGTHTQTASKIKTKLAMNLVLAGLTGQGEQYKNQISHIEPCIFYHIAEFHISSTNVRCYWVWRLWP